VTTQYFIGNFDGVRFTLDPTFPKESQRFDYGVCIISALSQCLTYPIHC
jgi:hypothetical protein